MAVTVGGIAAGAALGLGQVPAVVGSAGAVACIAAIGSLANQRTARLGNVLGMSGVTVAVAATLGGLWVDSPSLGVIQVGGE